MKLFVKKTGWFIHAHLPEKFRYLIEYIYIKHKVPLLWNPRDYSEFIFRDIFLNRNHSRAFLADKYRVREFVAQKGLGDILPQLYGVWDDARKIDFSKLPEQFALKCNHSCGMNIICADKSNLNIEQVVCQLNSWLKTSHPVYFESHYRKIKPLIICEEYISDHSGTFSYGL